jgi:hypothetical protein
MKLFLFDHQSGWIAAFQALDTASLSSSHVISSWTVVVLKIAGTGDERALQNNIFLRRIQATCTHSKCHHYKQARWS